MPVAEGTSHPTGQDVPAFQEQAEQLRLWDVPAPLRPGCVPGAESAPPRVLLAEDNMIAQASIRRLLEQQGMEVICAANGREALEWFNDGCYDVVMLDILMPDMDGFEVTSRIREKERLEGAGQTPVIALTSYSLKAVNDKCRSVGMNGYLSKPVSDNGLRQLFAGLRGNSAYSREGMGGSEGVGELPLLDVKGSLGNLGGDRELYREIVGMFVESAPEIIEGLIAALDSGDAALAERHAHNLKGMAANIGAQRLAELARVIQVSVRMTRKGEYHAWILRLRDEFESLTAAFAAAGETFAP